MEEKDLLLSVIVPIFKVEEYIEQCIDSLLKQTYEFMEIILVDDGSPDKCGVICDEYAKKDKRIRVLHKENGGVHDAENYGFQYATGDYIAYVDGDDYLNNEDSFQILMKEAKETKADIIVGNYHKDIAGELVSTNPHGFDEHTDTSTVDFRFKGMYSIGHLAYYWGKVYKKSFLVKHHLKMKPFVYSQDKLFNVECYVNQPKYSFVQESVYVYRSNIASISHQYKKDFTKIWLDISEEMYGNMQNIENGERYMDIVAFNLFFALFFSSKQEYIHSDKNTKAVISELKKFAANDLTKTFMKDMARGKYIHSIASLMWKVMMWFFSFGFSIKLYGILSLIIKIVINLDIDSMLSSTGKYRKRI
ncbi:MAG: glycosyltransferase [Eubacteriaceae bacterium]